MKTIYKCVRCGLEVAGSTDSLGEVRADNGPPDSDRTPKPALCIPCSEEKP